MKKNVFWIGAFGGLAALAILGMFLLPSLQTPGSQVCIRRGTDEILYRLPLGEDRRLTIPSENGGYNLVVIEGGKVWVEEASCPDQKCVRHKATNRTGDPIICLPNQLTLEVEQGNDDLDVVAQ